MKMRIYIALFSLMISTVVLGQEKDQEQLNREAREHVRTGNKLYNQLKFEEAEAEYKKALAKNPTYDKAAFNLGNTVYNQDRNKEAVGQYQLVEKTATEKMSKAEIFHNKGNAFMNEKDYAKAIDAYKNSLRNNSKDDETRYNLALAKKMLEEQQNKDQNKKDDKDKKDDQNKDKKKDQDKKEKEKEGGDEERKDDQQKDKEQGEDKKDDKAKDKKNEQQDKDNKQEQKPNPSQLTPEQMKQLLEAMNNEENKTQKKLNAQKAKGKKVKKEKDW